MPTQPNRKRRPRSSRLLAVAKVPPGKRFKWGGRLYQKDVCYRHEPAGEIHAVGAFRVQDGEYVCIPYDTIVHYPLR